MIQTSEQTGITMPDNMAVKHSEEKKCELRVISTDTEFDALEAQWNELLEQSDVTIFQTFEWLNSWWKYFKKPDDQLHIVLFLDDDLPIGVAPMFKRHFKLLGFRIVTQLQFIGCGLSDYIDIIITKGYKEIVLTTFTEYIHSNEKSWDVFDIEGVNEFSTVYKLLPDLLKKHGINVVAYRGNVCTQVAISKQENDEKGISTSYHFRRKWKKLQEKFNTSIVRYQDETDDIEAGVEAFARLHGERWRSLGYASAFDDPHHRAFHVEFSKKFARRGWLRLLFLTANDQRVAVSYTFNYRNHIYMYQCNAQGSEDVMKCSPGFLLRAIVMDEGRVEGMKLYDFLRGDEAYKYDGGKTTATTEWLLRGSPATLSGKTRFTLFLIFELLLKSRQRVQREVYAYRRFRITQQPSFWNTVCYAAGKMRELYSLVKGYVFRHSPFQKTQKELAT
ncbi:MAG: GNAT family N-acetyltransferase [Ignavibacteriae bacterium]|nr:GNAT family N-acetyltransferase [Ignavibacteriota bacterium]